MKGKLKKYLKIGVAVLVVTCIFAGVFRLMGRNALALIDKSKCIKYSEYSSSHDIPEKTLFIGTWLIDMYALNDDLYEKAMDSASESNQTEMYYKSELAGGAWKNVTQASSLTDISSAGDIVEDSELADLLVQYYVDSSGTVTDVVANKKIGPFDVPDPYDLRKLPELQTLYMQLTQDASVDSITQEDFFKNRGSEQSGKLRSDAYYYQILTAFFAMDLRDEETSKLDAQLERLNSMYESLKSSGKDEDADIVMKLMSKVDAARRAIIYDKLSMMDKNGLSTLYSLASGMFYTVKGDFGDSANLDNSNDYPSWSLPLLDAASHHFSYFKDIMSSDWYGSVAKYDLTYSGSSSDSSSESSSAADRGESFTTDQAIVDAISQAMSDCKTTYSDKLSNSLQDAENILGHAEYSYSNAVIEGGSDQDLQYLRYIYNIEGNKVEEAKGELSLIQGSLISLAESRYSEKLSQGESEEYKAAVENGRGTTAMENALDNEMSQAEDARSELQFLINGVKLRTPAKDALSYVYERIDWADGQYDGIGSSAFKVKAGQSVDAHIKWLNELAEEIKNSDESLKSKLDKLKDKKKELQEKRNECLDDNDLAGAKEYDASIDAVDQDIAEEEGNLAKRMNNDDQTAGTRAQARNNLGDSADSLAEQLKDEAKSKIASGDGDTIDSLVDALSDMGADDALNEVADALKDSGASDSDVNKVKEAAASAGSGASSGGGDGAKGSLSKDELLSIIEGLLGDIDSLSDGEMAAVTAALSQLNERGNDAAGELAKTFARKCIENKNKYIYQKYKKDLTNEYISLATIGKVTVYRYVYNDNKHEAILSHGKSVYSFKVGSASVGYRDGDQGDLDKEVVFSTYPYVAKSDGAAIFDCDCQYVNGMDQAVCITSSMKSIVNELLDAFGG